MLWTKEMNEVHSLVPCQPVHARSELSIHASGMRYEPDPQPSDELNAILEENIDAESHGALLRRRLQRLSSTSSEAREDSEE